MSLPWDDALPGLECRVGASNGKEKGKCKAYIRNHD